MLFSIRACITASHFLLVCCATLLVCLVRPFHRNNTHLCASWMSLILRPVLGVRFKALNDSPVGEQPAVYIINHQDVLDVFICTAMLPKNIAILGKTELRYIPVFGLAFWLAGNLYINRQNKQKAWDTMKSVAEVVRRRQRAIYMFPEGTRSNGKGLQPFKSGAFALAIEAGLPIVPIVFSSTHKHIDLNRLHSGPCLGRYLEPVSTDGLGEADVRELSERCHTLMKAAIDELDAELSAA